MSHRRFFKRATIVATLVIVLTAQAFAVPGDEHWDHQFGWPGPTNAAFALAEKDGKLYVGGLHSVGGPIATNNFVEVWDGVRWARVPGIFEDTLVLFDIAFMGDEMYVGGAFSRAGGVPANGLARWNGSSWSDVGGFAGLVRCLLVKDNNLYVGGSFTNLGGVAATNVAVWNGSQWASVGGGLGKFNGGASDYVTTLLFHNNVLYAGGAFTNAGDQQVRRFARWDGANWTEVNGGANDEVFAMASQGVDLYVGGAFTSIGGTAANRVARWDGVGFSPLGTGMNNDVVALGIANNRLHAGGAFTNAGGVLARRFAVWNGLSWSATGSGFNGDIYTIKIFGTNVHVGGQFNVVDDRLINQLAIWDGAHWSCPGPAGRINGVGGILGPVRSITTGGNDIYVGGFFPAVGPITAQRIARFDGTNWHALGSGMKGTNDTTGGSVNAIAVSGNNVYAGGSFTNAGGIAARNIARWDGTNWWPLGAGIPGNVAAIGVRGNEVYAGGAFTMSTPTGTAFNIAKWDGTTWSSLPCCMAGLINSFSINAITVQGNDIYIGGSFFVSGSSNIVRFDGVNWHPMGTGVNSNVNVIAVSGSDVYAGGRFTNASGVKVSKIAKWNGAAWSDMGGGVAGTGNFSVSGIALVGSDVYAGGNFTNAGGVNVNRIAKWNGVSWSALGSGVARDVGNAAIVAMAARGSDVFAGGGIEFAGGKRSMYLARWNEQIDFDFIPFMRLTKPLVGPLGFRASVTSSVDYVVEATEDFSTWQPIATNPPGSVAVDDPNAGPLRRFYRARQAP